ncbi:MAG TPA: DMT family transporter [Paracoccaceae bacterium]|nr:DMT family transporter [Paracoccaceae bacterium]HMO70844.1 DMT family transporter [Paracoccaceae bacterium]
MRYGTGVILVLVAAILWSLNALTIRLIDEADTWAVLFWRSVGMVPPLAALVLWRSGGRLVGPLRATGAAGLAGGAGLVVAFAGAIFAIQATTVANAVFLFAASPFLAALMGRLLLGEAVRTATWGTIALAGAGMFVMVREGLDLGLGAGTAAALLSALGFATFTVSLRHGRSGDMIPSVLIGGILSVVVAAAVSAMMGGALGVSARDIALSLGMGAFLIALGMFLYTLGSRVLPAAELTLLSMVEVLLAPIWAFAVLGEQASAATLVGGAVVLAAVAINALSGVARRPAQI